MDLLKQQLHKTCDHHRIDLVYAFGSRACEIKEFLCGRGEIDNENSSDVDMGVKSSPKRKAMSVREKVEMAAEIEDLLGVGRVDLVILSEADPSLPPPQAAGNALAFAVQKEPRCVMGK